MSMPVATSPILPLWDAVFTLLQADTELSDLVTQIGDWIDERDAYPYVRGGDAVETPDNTHDAHGSGTVITLDIWDRYKGNARILRIGNLVRGLLEHRPLTITGHQHVATYFVSTQLFVDPEPTGDIRHAQLMFRVVTTVTG